MTAPRRRRSDQPRIRSTEADRQQRREHLGTVIRSFRGDTTQFQLAERITEIRGEQFLQTSVSRWEKGMVDLSVEQLRDVELALNLEPGSILVAAGFVSPNTDVPTALRADSNLHPDLRDQLVYLYHGLLGISKKMLADEAARRRPTRKAAAS